LFKSLLRISKIRISDLLLVGAWRSLVAHLLWEQGVGGSNPLAPTMLSHPSELARGHSLFS
jgi:hypothetical protein